MLDCVRSAAIMIAHPRHNLFNKLSSKNTIAKLLPKAVEPSLDLWIDELQYSLIGMVLRDKIDGRRELLIIQNGKLIAISTRQIDEWDEAQETDTYIFDSEYYERDDTWYVLHVLVFKGRNVTNLNDGDRMKLLETSFPKVHGIRICPYVIVKNPEEDIPKWYSRNVEYCRDGLLLATNGPYWSQKCYKWKPVEESTLDMLVVRCPDWLEGKAPYVRSSPTDTLYLLNVGVSSNFAIKQNSIPMKRYFDIFGIDKNVQYVPQLFSPLNNPLVHIWSTERSDLHGYICEMLYDKKWILKRVRDDKPSILRGGTEIGNDIRTAIDIWSKQTHPFPLEYLWNPPRDNNNPYMDICSSVENAVAELLDEESAKTAISHMTPFVPFKQNRLIKAELVPSDDNWPLYKSRRVTVQQITYTHIGRITMPKDFIGGAHIVVTMDPEILAHVSCIAKIVSPGGRIIVVCRTRGSPKADSHPLVNKSVLIKEFERSGFVLLGEFDYQPEVFEEIHSRFDNWDIIGFRKENRGIAEMTTTEVHKENPHLIGNPDANFGMKFQRQKTKELTALNTDRDPCTSLEVDPCKGELLIDIEFLSTLSTGAQVLYFGDRIDSLKILFSDLNWIDVTQASSQNIEAIISHKTYDESVQILEQYEPHSALIDIDHNDMNEKVLKGKYMLIPFMPWDSSRVSIQIGRIREKWNIIPSMFEKEMQTFHRVYRPSAFKYCQRQPELDNCYDCRTQQYILSKYGRAKKLTIEEYNERFLKASITK
jgi:hypothetical protein